MNFGQNRCFASLLWWLLSFPLQSLYDYSLLKTRNSLVDHMTAKATHWTTLAIEITTFVSASVSNSPIFSKILLLRDFSFNVLFLAFFLSNFCFSTFFFASYPLSKWKKIKQQILTTYEFQSKQVDFLILRSGQKTSL